MKSMHAESKIMRFPSVYSLRKGSNDINTSHMHLVLNSLLDL
jgi:hypothetical protein